MPSPPGLVSVMLAPDEVVGRQRVRARLLDERVVGVQEPRRRSALPAPRITGTISVREPSFFSTSTARPRLTWPSIDPVGLAVDLGEVVAITGISLAGAGDRVGDQVGEGDLARPAFSSRRRPSSVVTVSVRKLVAVGIEQRLLHVARERRGAAPHRLELASAGAAAPLAAPVPSAARRGRRTW